MKIQTVKFPATPEQAEQKIEELRPLLDAYYAETKGGNADKFPTQMLVMMWHSFLIDFIEVLNDEGERVGLMMNSIVDDLVSEGRSALVLAFYLKEDYRGQGLFKRAMKYATTVYQARSFSHIDLPVKQKLDWFGSEHALTYRKEL